jgi:REP element-mobilizing transposase RayT
VVHLAYKHRIEAPGLYHLTARGNNKRTIFVDDVDRRLFVAMLNRTATRHGWVLFAVCLMDNHYHLIMRIGERGMSRGMCELNTGYAVTFNGRHGRINHLFGRRYWSDHLESNPADAERRFMAALRYVILNPVKAGLTTTPEAYVWSSYRATIGLALGFVRVASEELLRMFARDRVAAIRELRKLCEAPVSLSHDRWQPP